MKKVIGLFLLLLPLSVFAADTGRIVGKVVLGNDRQAIAGVNVVLVGTQMGSSTNAAGEFSIDDVPPGVYSVQASCIGYATRRADEVVVKAGDKVNLEFSLPEQILEMQEVVVTGSLLQHKLKDTPVITEVISLKDIKDIGSFNLVEVMREQTGVDISYGVGRTQSAQLHGLSDNHVLILIDGERVAGKVDGAIDLGQIPVEQIARIETVKGPLSSIYGSDALGGVINIITKDPGSSPAASAGVTVGNNGRQDYSFSTARSLKTPGSDTKNLSLALGGSWNKHFGIDYDKTDNFMELPGYDRKSLYLKSGFIGSERLKIDAKFDYYKDEMDWLAGNQTNPLKDISSNEKLTYTSTAKYTLPSGTSVKLVANLSKNDHGLRELAGPGYEITNNLQSENLQNYRLQLTTIPYHTSVLALGIERTDESIDSDRIIGRTKDYSSNVLFVEDEWVISKLTFTVGGRYSDNSVYGAFFSPKMSAMYRPFENLKLRMAYGRGFREPSLKELFIDFRSSVGYEVVGEPGLTPEKSNGYNLGLEYNRSKKFWLRANVYDNQVQNLIDYYTKASNGDRVVLSYYNVQNATTRGLDLDIDFDPNRFLQLTLGYNFTQAKDNFGNDLPFRVPHTLNWKIAASAESLGLNANLRGRWFDRKPVTDDQTNKNIYSGADQANQYYVPAYAVWDMQLRKRFFGTLDFSVGINNIGNQRKYPFGQIKGREYYAGLTYQL